MWPVATAACAVSVGRRQPVVGAGVALALLAGVSAEVPLYGLCLAVGALALGIDRRDSQGIYAALAGVKVNEPIVANRPLD